MSMSTHIVGFAEPTDEYRKKARAWHACKEAGVDIPDELLDYFEDGPDPNGHEVDVPKTEWSTDYGAEGFEVRVADIPKNVTVIRFYNSW